jgi:hypothetical protein
MGQSFSWIRKVSAPEMGWKINQETSFPKEVTKSCGVFANRTGKIDRRRRAMIKRCSIRARRQRFGFEFGYRVWVTQFRFALRCQEDPALLLPRAPHAYVQVGEIRVSGERNTG